MRLPSSLFATTEALRQGWGTARAHPLRSALGGLAVAVAVGTVVSVDASLFALREYARRSTARTFGADTFVLAQVASAGQVSRRELARKLERNPPLRRTELRFLEQNAAGRAIYAATVQTRADLTAGSRRFEHAAVNGTGAALPELRELALSRGRFFLPEEERRAEAVVVLGHDVAETLFPGRDPLGQALRLGRRAFTVIGVQEKQGSAGGVSLDRYVWIPLRAWERVFGPAATLQITGKAPGAQAYTVAEDRARAALRARRSLRPGEEDDFDVLTPDAARGFVLRLAERVSAAAPPLSFMALLAAVVVIANTTLVSVTQRTREIGVRRALGASRGRVMAEVLAESALVALAGGACGLLGGLALAEAARAVSGAEFVVRGSAAALGLATSLGAGLLAGLYPAHRAGLVDVISALRLE